MRGPIVSIGNLTIGSGRRGAVGIPGVDINLYTSVMTICRNMESSNRDGNSSGCMFTPLLDTSNSKDLRTYLSYKLIINI
jgi:hypothetical protein